MGKQSTRENKTIYQQYREEQGLTREKASQEMTGAISILTYAIITVLTSV